MTLLCVSSVTQTADAVYRSVLSQKAPRSPSDWPVGGYQCRSSNKKRNRSSSRASGPPSTNSSPPPLDGNTYPASRPYLVNCCSHTGQSGEAVHVDLAAVRLSSHQVGSGSQRDVTEVYCTRIGLHCK